MNGCMLAHAKPDEEDRAREEWFATFEERRRARDEEDARVKGRRMEVIRMMREDDEKKRASGESSPFLSFIVFGYLDWREGFALLCYACSLAYLVGLIVFGRFCIVLEDEDCGFVVALCTCTVFSILLRKKENKYMNLLP